MGWHLVHNRLGEAGRDMPEKVGRIVEKTARDMQADAIQRAPIDTGNLRGTTTLERVADATYRLTFHAAYAIYQELGTRRMRARPYMVPAWQAAGYRLMQAIRRLEL